MSKKQNERKKKKREEIAKKRVLARREQIRNQRKKEAEDRQRYETEYELKNGKQKPFIKNEDPEKIKKRDEAILKKIEENNKILEALNKEYARKNKKIIKRNQTKENQYKKMSVKERIRLAKENNKEPVLFPGDTITSLDVE